MVVTRSKTSPDSMSAQGSEATPKNLPGPVFEIYLTQNDIERKLRLKITSSDIVRVQVKLISDLVCSGT